MSVSSATATALTDPTVTVTLGGTQVASGNLTAQAISRTDADATVTGSGGGAVNVGSYTTNANNVPNVTTTVNAGTYLEAGGTLVIEARHGAAPEPLSDGTIIGVDTGNGAGGVNGNSLTLNGPMDC